MTWQRISATEYRLDEVWTVQCRYGGWWQAWRGNRVCVAMFADVEAAKAEAERLRKEDEEKR